MKLLKQFIKFLVNSNLLIAIAAAAFTLQTFLLANGLDQALHYTLLVFFATLLVYNGFRLLAIPSMQKDDPYSEMHSWIYRYIKWVYALLGISLMVILYCYLYLDRQVQIVLAILGVVSFFYALPIFKNARFSFALRDLGISKPLLVGLVWGFATAYLPILVMNPAIGTEELSMIVLQRVLFITAITIPFDVRDMEHDRQFLRFKTLPLLIGVRPAMYVAVGLLLLFLVLVMIPLWPDVNQPITYAYLLSFLPTLYLILRTNLQRGEFHYTFWLDAMIPFQFLLILVAVFLG